MTDQELVMTMRYRVVVRVLGQDVASQQVVHAYGHEEAARMVALPDYPPEGPGRTVVYFHAKQADGDAEAEIAVERVE